MYVLLRNPPWLSALTDSSLVRDIRRVALELNVDYGDAVVGFDFRGGRTIPLCDGIVVAAENEAPILEVLIRLTLDDRHRLTH